MNKIISNYQSQGRGQRVEGRRQRAEGRGQKAEGRGQKVEERRLASLDKIKLFSLILFPVSTKNSAVSKFLHPFVLLSLYFLLPHSANANPMLEPKLQLSEPELEGLQVGKLESSDVYRLSTPHAQADAEFRVDGSEQSAQNMGQLEGDGEAGEVGEVGEDEEAREAGEDGRQSSPSPQSSVPSPQSSTLNPQPSVLSPQPSVLTSQSSESAEVRILSPENGVTGAKTTNLVIQYPAESQIQINVNEKALDLSQLTQTQERDATTNLVTQVWYNIPLKKGDNTITVQVGNGQPVSLQLKRQEREGKAVPYRVEVGPADQVQVRADGRSTIKLAGRITDEEGELIPEDFIVTLTASAGKFVGSDEDRDQAGFQVVARGGQFTADLQSSLEAQKVRIRAAVEPRSSKPRKRRRSPEIEENVPVPPAPFLGAYNYPTSSLEAYTQVEFITNLRQPIVSGVIDLRIGPRGTNFWGSRREFLTPDLDEGTEFDVDASVFATGRVGEWLFTGAYNSERPLNETCDGTTRLFRDIQFCDQPYPVYGDSSTVDYLTPSTDSVYARLERTSPVEGAEPDYVMWGDYYTTEFSRSSQLFTATNRALHGFKGSYNLGNLQVTALYSPDVEGFQRDSITPDGTSGYYFLSRRLLVEGSETVYIETEEINRPGTVLERKRLNRNTDYEIDYDRGTLLFRRPIQAIELDAFEGTRVRRIVATYQYEGGGGDETKIYGGRLQYNFSHEQGRESFGGLTYLRENQGDRDFELYGADLFIPLGNQGRIVGEYAHSTNNSIYSGLVTGNAYRLEANWGIGFGRSDCPEFGSRDSTGTTPLLESGNQDSSLGPQSSACTFSTTGISGTAYYRNVEEGFANNATTSFTPGQTRYGTSVAARVTSTTQLMASYDHEVNYGTASLERIEFFDIFDPQPEARPGERLNNSLTTVRAGILQKIGDSALSVEYVNRVRDDRINDTFDGDAAQLVSRLKVPLTQSLLFQAQNELNLGGTDPLYPDRTTFGLDWKAFPGVTLRLAHQFYEDGILGNNAITSLDTILEHKLGEDTSITGRYSLISGYNSITGQGAVGMNHRWRIAPGLRLHLGYEHIFSNIFSETAAGPRYRQPYAVGQSAASLGIGSGDAYSVGLEYSDNPDFQASARFEHRTGEGGNNTLITAAAAGKISDSLTALARYEQGNYSNQLLSGRLGDTINLRVGLAYRNPKSDQFNGLFKYEYRQNPSSIPETLLLGSGSAATEHIFSLEGIYAPSWRWEFFGKYALRNSNTYLSDDFENSSTVSLAQLRTTYRLGYRWDLAGEVRWIHQSDVNYDETGFALEAGYYLTPDLRASLGYSFGSVDDRDFTGYRSEGGVYFGLTFKLNELLGGFGRQRVVPRQQQESEVGQQNPGGEEQRRQDAGMEPHFHFPIAKTMNLAVQRVQDVTNVMDQLWLADEQLTDDFTSVGVEERLRSTSFIFLPKLLGGREQ